MSVSIAQVNSSPSGDTFQIWVDQTNKAINAISTVCVTVNTHANGGLTTGNGFVEGTFGARNLVANTMRGGTVQTSAVLTLTSNLNVSGNTITVGNVVINSTAVAIDGVPIEPLAASTFSATTTGTTAQLIDSFSKLTYRTADYIVSIKNTSANGYQATKAIVIHNGGTTSGVDLTEFGITYSNNSLGTLSANANTTHVRLYLTPTPATTEVKGSKTLVVL